MRVREGERERGREKERGREEERWREKGREKGREEGIESVQSFYVLHVAIQMWLLQNLMLIL